MAEDRAHDPRRVYKTVDSSAAEDSIRNSWSGLTHGDYPTSEILRSNTAESRSTGFKGEFKNNVRTRTPGGSGPDGDFLTPKKYNELSTALTNMTGSGEISKLTSEGRARVERRSPQIKKSPIKISSDPAKGK